MSNGTDESVTHERTVTVHNGWFMLAVNLGLLVAGLVLLFSTLASVPELAAGEIGFSNRAGSMTIISLPIAWYLKN